MAILNLPRQERFLRKNVVLVGVIPLPKEPKKTINICCLTPLVEEFQRLWRGVVITHGGLSVLVCTALLCCGYDILAARKCCGFVACNTLYGCSKCLV